jgi:putative flippase GtrA
VLRFLVVGGTNTVWTAAAFYVLATMLPARIAFTIVYCAGLAFVVVVTPRYVFGSRTSWQRRLLLALWYAGTYVVGVGMISLLSSALAAPRVAVVLGTTAVTAPLSFVGSRLLVGRGYAPGTAASGSGSGSTPSG